LKSFESFNDLSIPAPLSDALKKMEFTKPTPVQQASIPAALLGRDILGTAQTGTGKTGAFGIPLLAKLYAEPQKLALILAPTRELAAQIHRVLRQMAKGSNIRGSLVVGGESFNRQADEMYDGVDYIVATPGRLSDHLNERTADLNRVAYLVLDEVDRMLDMGFAPQIKHILQFLPKTRQTLLFSATLPTEAATLAAKFLTNPVRVAIGPTSQPLTQVTEKTIKTNNEAKTGLVLKELEEREGRTLIFTRTKSRADRLARILYTKGHSPVCLHGGKSQGQRKQALERFRSGSHRIMVATDLAGRGIDVADIEQVINYDVPMNREDYIHRIGRTGRFGKTGSALNLLVSGDTEGEEIITGVRASKSAPKPKAPWKSSKPRQFGRKSNFRSASGTRGQWR
jgi:ATP-dependent RNA helicase DeaD